MEYREYRSDISDNFVIYKIDNDNRKIYIENMYYKPENIKLFLIDLHNSFQDIQEMFTDYHYVQIVDNIEWKKYLESNILWKKISSDEYFTTIECELCNAFQNIIKGLGVFEDHTDYDTIM